MTTTVLCVLRLGGGFDHGHVARLRHQVRRHAPRSPFVALTDSKIVPADCARRLEHGWPGWWSKVEALRVPGPCLYLDLDVSVVGDLGPLLDEAARHDLVMCRGFWGDEDPNPLNSSIMGWRGDAPRRLHDLFLTRPAEFIGRGRARACWGDQGFIAANFEGRIAAWQDLLPGAVVSYKRGALRGERMDDCRVLASHGDPRPWAPGGADEWLARGTAA